MTDPHAIDRLLWEGDATVEQATRALQQGRGVRLELPGSYHHSLFAHLHPSQPAGNQERIEEEGDRHLLEQVAALPGLEAIGRLAKAGGEVRVRVESPAPVVLICPAG